jgi:8-oxo-dGTP diphosphatase
MSLMSNNGQFFAASAAIIISDNGEVLLTRRGLTRDHHPGEWEITTGRLLQGESFEEALHREVREELGVEVEILKPLSTFHFYRGAERAEHVGVQFLCKLHAGAPKADGVEEITVKWVTLQDAIDLVKDESIQAALRDALPYVVQN